MIPFSKDLAERVASTFGEAFLGAVVLAWGASPVSHNIYDLSSWEKLLGAAAGAGIVAVFALLKGVVAAKVTGTPSLAAKQGSAPNHEGK